MSDQSQTLEFRITTPAELAGAQAAADALERQIGKAKALKQDYSELQKQLDTINTSLAEHTHGLGDASEKVEIFNVHGREMNRLFVEADRLLPGTGELLRAAFRPETLGIATTVLLISQMVKWIGETQKAIEDAARAEAELTTGTWEAQEKAAGAAATSAEDYAIAVGKIGQNINQLKTDEEHDKAVLDAQIQQRRTLLELMEKEALAKIKFNQSLSATQKQIAEDNVRAAFEKQSAAAALKAEQAHIDLLQTDLDKAKTKNPELQTASDTAQKAVTVAKTELAGRGLDVVRAELAKKLPEQKSAQILATEDYEDAKSRLGTSRKPGDAELLAAKKSAMDEATINYNRTLGHIADIDKTTEELTGKIKALEAAASDAFKALQENGSNIKTWGDQIKTMTDVLTVHQETAAKAAPYQASIHAVEEEGLTRNQIDKDVEAIDKAARASHPSAEVSAAAVSAINDLKEIYTQHTQLFVAELQKLHRTFADVNRKAEVALTTSRQALEHANLH